MKLIFFITLTLWSTLWSNLSLSQVDLIVGAQGRTYPGIGAEARIESGYNYLLWGEGKRENPLYGLIRPAINATSSAVINSYGAEIGFYPISILGIERGFRNVQSDFGKFNFYDCDEVRCKGSLKRDYTTYKLALGYKNLVAMGRVQISDNKYSNGGERNKPVAEFRFASLANPREDSHYYSQYVIAWRSSQLKGLIGIAKDYARFQESGMEFHSTFLVYSTKIEDENWVFGFGGFESDHWEKGSVFYLRWNYEIYPTKKFF